MRALLHDLRYGLRSLLAQPGFTAVALVTLALGIGAVSAIFSVVDGVLLRPLPYPEPERLVTLWQSQAGAEELPQPVSPHNLFDVRDQLDLFADLAGFLSWNYTVASPQGEAERLKGSGVSESLFRLLGAEAVLGRTFTPEEDTDGNDRVVVLSHGLWQRYYGSDPGVLGESIVLEGEPYTIVGVIEPGFSFPAETQLWKPLGFEGMELPPAMRARQILRAIGRLEPGVTLASARAELDALARHLAAEYPDFARDLSLPLIPLHEQVVGDVRPALWLLLGAVSLVLLIACANVANLLLARAAARQGELAIRTAMGASRGRLVRQMLTESLLLAVAGGALGLLLAYLALRILRWLGPQAIPRLDAVALDGRILAFTFAVSVVTGLLFGTLPALRSAGPRLTRQLKEGGRTGRGGLGDLRSRGLLVIAEVAVALTLLFATGIVLKSFNRLVQVEPGFDPDDVLTLEVTLIWDQYDEPHESAGFYRQALAGIGALPGVEAAGVACFLPLSGAANVPHGKLASGFAIAGRPAAETENEVVAFQPVSPGFFRTLGVPLLAGRRFEDGDATGAPQVVIVNQAMARRFWPDGDPLGQRIQFSVHRGPVGSIPEGEWQVVGVVGDVRENGLAAQAEPELYFPLYQSNWRVATFVVRTAGDPMTAAGPVRQAIRSVDSGQAIANVRTLEEVVFGSVGRERFNVWLLSLFGVIALVLAGVGVYGVISYSVNQRAHEIGVRLALGARRGSVLRLVVGEGLLLGVIGVALGIGAAFVLTRWIGSQLADLLFEVSATDLATLVAVALTLIGVTAAASFLPARRATRVDPVTALRYD